MNNYEELHKIISQLLKDFRKIDSVHGDETIIADYEKALNALYILEFHLRLRAFKDAPTDPGDEALKIFASRISARTIKSIL